MSGNNGWIGVDLDGTLAHYDTWKGVDHIGAPIQPMVDRVQAWLDDGRKVKIFTARVCRDHERDIVIGHIHAWCAKHGLPQLEVTNVKDFNMAVLYDDRCVQVEFNTGRLIGVDEQADD
jgi:hypothetical protein